MTRKTMVFCTLEKFIITLANILTFAEGEAWGIDEWELAYSAFKDYLSYRDPNSFENKLVEQIITEWAKEFYQDFKPATHSCWLKG